MRKVRLSLLVSLLIASGCANLSPNTKHNTTPPAYTYVDLVNRLIDLEHLATLPQPGEKGLLASSYDRRSRYDAATGEYLEWDANGDNNGRVGEEGGKLVLADLKGPGCVWRIWSAEPRQGHMRIYLDGSPTPVLDLPFKDLFTATHAPFNRTSLVYRTPAVPGGGAGCNSYVPIPFQKSCRIVADGDWGQYYQFTYSVFPAGTQVPTFRPDLSPQENAALDRVDQFLKNQLGSDPSPRRRGEKTLTATIDATPGKTLPVAEISGRRAITALRISLPPAPNSDPELRVFLRQTILQIAWDDETNPSVCVPLGDFFATTPGAHPLKSLPVTVSTQTLAAFWYMPFAKNARISIRNDGAASLPLTFSITHAPLSQSVRTLGRFHAKWHRDLFPPKEKGRAIDWTLLKTQGRGRYCGAMLHVWNPRGGWWGEGDEKFFVDGEKFPSCFGTGAEDYFGYAWCNAAPFQAPFHNQPYADKQNVGNICVSRWQIADNVPFQSSFDGSIEKYYPNDRPCLFASTVYWYLSADGTDPYTAEALDHRRDYFPLKAPRQVAGAIEAEDLPIVRRTGGNTDRQYMAIDYGAGRWSGDAQLVWTWAKPGARLTFLVPVAKSGKYDLTVALTRAKDFGTIQFALDGRKIGQPVDLYNPEVTPLPPFSIATPDLSAGSHELTMELVGSNKKAEGTFVGIDYIKLIRR